MPEIVLHKGVERRELRPSGTEQNPRAKLAYAPALIPTALSFSNVIVSGFPSFA